MKILSQISNLSVMAGNPSYSTVEGISLAHNLLTSMAEVAAVWGPGGPDGPEGPGGPGGRRGLRGPRLLDIRNNKLTQVQLKIYLNLLNPGERAKIIYFHVAAIFHLFSYLSASNFGCGLIV